MTNRCKPVRALFTVWLAGLAFAGMAAGQGDAPPPIREIAVDVRGPGRVDRGFVRAHTSLAVGDELDQRLVARDLKSLLDTGVFRDVRIYVEPADDGVRLIYEVVNRWLLSGPVQFEGLERYRAARARTWLDLRPGDPIDDALVGARVQRLLEEYRDDFYPRAEAAWRIDEIDAEDGLARLTVVVKEGSRSRIQTIRFEGNERIKTGTLRKVVAQRPWWNPIGWFVKRSYDPDELALHRVDLQDAYLAEGFLDATVSEPEIEVLRNGKIRVTYTVEEGERYRFADVSVDGATVFPLSVLRRFVRCETGAPALRPMVRDTVQAIRDYYGTRGYLDCDVDPLLTPDAETGRVDVRFAITEGKEARVRNVYIRGNTRTRDKVIRRELQVFPGEIYNTVRVRGSERRLMNLGFFSHVRSYDETTFLPEQRDLVFDVEEKRTGQLMLGTGFSSIDKLIGFVEVSQGNFDLTGWPTFTGGGQKLRLRAQFGTVRQRYEASFTEPWFLDRRLSLGVDAFRSDVDYSDYDLNRVGGAVTVGRYLFGRNRINFRYQLEGIDLSNFADTNAYVFADMPDRTYSFPTEEDTTESSLRVSLTHDSRDRPFVPTRGNRITLSGSLTGGPLGFDTDIYGAELRTWHYVPLWFGHVFSVKTRYETVDAYGNLDEAPLANRLFLGGGRSLRGFDYRDVGPKVIRSFRNLSGGTSFTHRPYGGQSLALAQVEYTIPVFSLFRLAAFYDTGNVWLDAYTLEMNDLAATAGVGVRLDMPGFPIRVDRAWVVDRDDEFTDEDPWVVWIGYDY